jgi:hypothetical protein
MKPTREEAEESLRASPDPEVTSEMRIALVLLIVGQIPERHLPDGRTLYVYPLLFGRARLQIGSDDNPDSVYDEW